jgi:[ribosomal protein S5]-alanine N-acetyltransferase
MLRELPYIESDRLILRLLVDTDHEAALEFWRSNQVHLKPCSPKWPDDYLTEKFWKAQIERHIREYHEDISVRMYLFEKDLPEVAGFVSFGGILRSAAQFCYLGYGLAGKKQGLGYMSEMLPHAIRFAFDSLSIHRIMANYVPTNERSGKLLKRLGFTVEGYARDYLNLNGKWEDHILTSLTNTSWQPKI